MGHDFRKRLVAARILAGHRSAQALADAIDEEGLGVKVINKFQQGRGKPTPSQLPTIAKACGVPVEWFWADLGQVATIADRQITAKAYLADVPIGGASVDRREAIEAGFGGEGAQSPSGGRGSAAAKRGRRPPSPASKRQPKAS